MTLTLLLDLDDTLLDTRIDSFIPAYFQALAAAHAGRVSPEILLKSLMLGTRAMMDKATPLHTLKEDFDALFYPGMGVRREDMQADIDRFYEERFPQLRDVTGGPLPGGVEFVEWALEAGHRVAIATDPYFPRRATEHRLDWAGLPVERYPFAMVSSYETFHFTKNQPAYYAEVLGRVGWPDGPVLMVGDDWERDMSPALRAGLPVFWLTGTETPLPEGDGRPRGRGSLADLRSWLELQDLSTLQVDLNSPSALDAFLRAAPAAADALLADLAAGDWTRRPADGGWSATEIACHLRDVAREVDLSRLRSVLSEENPFLAGQMTDEWASRRDYQAQDGQQALDGFLAARMELLDALAGLTAEEWQRPARHAIFGPTRLIELVRFMVEHDSAHLQQIRRVIA